MSEHPSRDTLQKYYQGDLDTTVKGGVAGHIQGCSLCRDVLAAIHEQSTTPAPGAAPLPPPSSPGDLAPSLPLCPLAYPLGQQLGEGGMALVYEGYDPILQRTVAIKTLHPKLRRPELEKRFIEEAQTTSQLQHPCIPPVHAFGYLPDGRPFFAMRRVKGKKLSELIKKRASAREELPFFLRIFEQVCQAVAMPTARASSTAT